VTVSVGEDDILLDNEDNDEEHDEEEEVEEQEELSLSVV